MVSDKKIIRILKKSLDENEVCGPVVGIAEPHCQCWRCSTRHLIAVLERKNKEDK